ncbi:MAG: DNA polymerase-3 subunit delta' [Gammaproteobacteria bacterium]|jgi:DNA polymerase-3 subunit delta'
MSLPPPSSAKIFPWQRAQWQRLYDALVREQLSHALLITGEAGTGRAQFAQYLLNAIVCSNRQPEVPAPCGQCRSCTLLQAGTHPGVRIVEPEPDKVSIGIDAVRRAIEHISLTTSVGSVKGVLIAPANALTMSAANALLKTLEEPPGSTYFLLVADTASTLPATVRSRCMAVAIPTPNVEESARWLRDTLPGAEALAGQALGGPLRALALYEADMAEPLLEVRRMLFRLVTGGPEPGHAASVLHGLCDATTVLSLMQRMVHQLTRLKFGMGVPLSGKELHSLTGLAETLEFSRLFSLSERIVAAQADLRSNPSLRDLMLIEELAVHWRELRNVTLRK